MLINEIVAGAEPDQLGSFNGVLNSFAPFPRARISKSRCAYIERSGVSAMVPRIFKRIIVKRKNFTQPIKCASTGGHP